MGPEAQRQAPLSERLAKYKGTPVTLQPTDTLSWLEAMRAWRRGEPEATSWAIRELELGDADLWLDPLLPTFAFAEPGVYTPALRQGVRHLAAHVVENNHASHRALCRETDDWGLAKRCLQIAWEEAVWPEEILHMLWPWSGPLLFDGIEEEFLHVANNGNTLRWLAQSGQLLEYTQTLVEVWEESGCSEAIVGAEETGSGLWPQVLEAARLWISQEEVPFWAQADAVASLNERLSEHYLSPTDLGIRFLVNRGDFLAEMRNRATAPAKIGEVILKLKHKYPLCPLLKYLPQADTLRLSEYGTLPLNNPYLGKGQCPP